MPKFFEYEDPELAAHVERIVELARDAEENESVVPKDTTIHANNNLKKPFAPMTSEDIERRHALGAGGGKDHFVVAEHREEQEKFVEKYERLNCDRDVGGNFHVSAGQMSKVAQVVVDEKVKEQKNMGFFKRVAAAISFSQEAKEKRALMKDLKEAVKKGQGA